MLLGLTLDELTTEVTTLGMPRFTGKQIAQWLYDKRVTSIDEMTNLSKANRALLSEHFEVGRSAPVMSQLSKDGTRKYLFQVKAGGLVEAVFIPEKDRATLCISSQVGFIRISPTKKGLKYCFQLFIQSLSSVSDFISTPSPISQNSFNSSKVFLISSKSAVLSASESR